MDKFLNTPNKQIDTSWIESLALDELNMEESGVIRFDEHLNPQSYLEESSIKFMDQVRDKLEVYVNLFNQYRGGDQTPKIKIFKISNTINDFMLFRNSLRLVFARRSNDCITIGFLSNREGMFSPRVNFTDNGELKGENSFHEIKANIGPYNSVSWRFRGEPIDIDAMVRHYLTEFIKNSAT